MGQFWKTESKASVKRACHVRLENSPAHHVPWEDLESMLFIKAMRNELAELARGVPASLRLSTGQGKWQELLLGDWASVAMGRKRSFSSRGQMGHLAIRGTWKQNHSGSQGTRPRGMTEITKRTWSYVNEPKRTPAYCP